MKRCTPAAGGVLKSAAREAERRRRPYLGSDLILAEFLRDKDNLGAHGLRSVDRSSVALAQLREMMESSQFFDRAPEGTEPERVQAVLRNAVRLAAESGEERVNTIHLLLALLDEEAGASARLLRDVGVADELRDKLNAMLTAN